MRYPPAEKIEIIRIVEQSLLSAKQSEVKRTIQSIASQTGHEHKPAKPGEIVSGRYRLRIDLAAGRFAMLDAGTGFELLPGVGIDWEPGRGRGVGQ